VRYVTVQLPDPVNHPDYQRRHVQPPSWATFGHRTHFVALRGFAIENNRIVRFSQEMDKYTKQFDLGDVLWPSYPIIFAENLDELVAEIKKRGLFLFDIWGYVPGSGPGDYWMQFKPKREVFDLLERELGDHWLGMDIGEQDGRYIGGYASQVHRASLDRFEAYLAFQRHFEFMANELGNRLSTLVSLNYGHYFLKEGLYTSIGAETAQALPNSQVYYAFIRGAGKQYGVPWFGNASVWNRWGWKTYDGSDPKANPPYGPEEGTSLSLLKRLIYSHILYNSLFVGFESGWFQGDHLSPIGKIQRSAHEWAKATGTPGVMQTPIAFMTDFFAGWTFPRHLYTEDVYRVWGIQPYGPGDYWLDALLSMTYPGYQDASYFHDERGFLVPTPYGDIVDCLLSDAEPWLLQQYATIVLAGEVSGGAELRDKLEHYVQNGGTLIITGGNLARFSAPICGVSAASQSLRIPADAKVHVGNVSVTEEHSFDVHPLLFSKEIGTVLARWRRTPLCVEQPYGKGRIRVFAAAYGMNAEPLVQDIPNKVEQELPKPFVMLRHVRAVLDDTFRAQMLFDVGNELMWVVCRRDRGEYTVGIFNPTLEQKPFSLISHCGDIESVQELPLDQSEKSAVGYLPKGHEHAPIGTNDSGTIAGADVRIFSVKVREEHVLALPPPSAPARQKERILSLDAGRNLKEQILARPTFFEHFDGVLVDWKYVVVREPRVLQAEAGWLRRQGVRVYVDLTSGINLYPDLRLVNNSEEDYKESLKVIENVLDKMVVLGSQDLILSLHRQPENSFTREQTMMSFEETLKKICTDAASRNITVYLRETQKFYLPSKELFVLLRRTGATNLFLAMSLAAWSEDGLDVSEQDLPLIGLWLLASSERDAAGKIWTVHAPAAKRGEPSRLVSLLRTKPSIPVVFDGVYGNADEEYYESVFLDDLMKQL